MFLGTNAINIDAKGRMAIPTRIRDELMADCAGRLVITAHTEERCLLIYPEPQWRELLPQIQSLPNMNKHARRVQRLLIGYAAEQVLDGNGRVLLPPALRDYAGLDKRVMLVGQGKKLELWSEERWSAWLDQDDFDEEVPAAVLALSL